jgi:hypothetical protein
MRSRSTQASARSSLTLLARFPVGRVDHVGANPEPLSRRDLIAHQRQETRDAQSRPGYALAQQGSRNEADRRLPPNRQLDAQHARAVLHQVAYGLELCGRKPASGPARSAGRAAARSSRVSVSIAPRVGRPCVGACQATHGGEAPRLAVRARAPITNGRDHGAAAVQDVDLWAASGTGPIAGAKAGASRLGLPGRVRRQLVLGSLRTLK